MTFLKERVFNLVDPFLRIPVGGLDISDSSVKYLKFRPLRKGITLDFWGDFALPEGLIVNGEIKNEEALISFLASWLDRDDKKMRSCFFNVSLPEEKSFLREVQLPKMKAEDAANAVRWEIETNVPLPLEEVLYDHEVIDASRSESDHTDVVVTAFPRSVIESYVKVLRAAGFRVAALELESQAVARAITGGQVSDEAKILVDIGRNRTSITLFTGKSVAFTNTFETGGKYFEESISKALGISAEEAPSIKKDFGLDKKAYEGKLFSAISPLVAKLRDEVGRVIDYYKNRVRGAHGAAETLSEIILVGGDANLMGLDTYLSVSLRVSTRRADPFASLENKLDMLIPPIPKNRALGFVSAIGLALRETELSKS